MNRNEYMFRNGEISKFYKFQLVLMNSDCEYWSDEKLSVAFEAGSVPVVMAAETIVHFLPGRLRQSVILIRDYDSPRKLADYLLYLSKNEREYRQYLEWKTKGLGFPQSYFESCLGQWWDSRYMMYCRVCMELAKGNKGHDGLDVMNCPIRTLRDWIKDDEAYMDAMEYAKNTTFGATV